MARNKEKKNEPPNGGSDYVKPELLAPAGEMRSLKAAVAAGADAVYLGGDKFGARAYAPNFSNKELEETIRFSHLKGVKVYLTLNTLIKESEFGELYGYLAPLDALGLDGLIIQDIGVMDFVADTFPEIAIHVSTQAAVTGVRGAGLFKSLGVKRVVPARELSLAELKRIKAGTGLEIEAFIHGAMCYSCSGMCLFSAMIGGMSGNRGRCKGACRLPYTAEGSDLKLPSHPLSMRDMCTLPVLQKLLEPADDGTGLIIDSLKIEGRMKDPVYAAGVTDVYRRAIDEITENPGREYIPSERDIMTLKGLYLRDDLCEGYFFKGFSNKNGSEMITRDAPGYNGTDRDIKKRVTENFLREDKKVPVRAKLTARAGSGLELSLETADGSAEVDVTGSVVEEALNSPSDVTSLKKQLDRFGGSLFVLDSAEIETDGQSFVPASLVNELRREAVSALETKMIEGYRRGNNTVRDTVQERVCERTEAHRPLRTVSVETLGQLEAVLSMKDAPDRLYLTPELIEREGKRVRDASEVEIFAALPHLLRDDGGPGSDDIERMLFDDVCGIKPDGALVRNWEELSLLSDKSYEGAIVADAQVPAWNLRSAAYLLAIADGITWSPELKFKEIEDVLRSLTPEETVRTGVVVYGRVPMMVSANCVKKTGDRCTGAGRHVTDTVRLRDRKGNLLPVKCYCRTCYNVLWNACPTALFKEEESIRTLGVGELRLEFTTESGRETKAVLSGDLEGMPMTSGRFIKGVE